MNNRLKPIDRQILKYSPDQFQLRLNEMITVINRMSERVELTDANSDKVVVCGNQPDGTFGIASWHKQGEQYTLITRLT